MLLLLVDYFLWQKKDLIKDLLVETASEKIGSDCTRATCYAVIKSEKIGSGCTRATS